MQQTQLPGNWTRGEIMGLPPRWRDAYSALSAQQSLAWQCDDSGLEAAVEQCLATLHQEAQQRGLL
jgi:hypothetical protein